MPQKKWVQASGPKAGFREILGWAMYDVANQAYTTVVISFVYGAFFVTHIVPADSVMRDSYWSLALIGSLLAAMVLSPVIGLRLDQGWHRKRVLAVSTGICSLVTACLFWVDPGQVWLGVALLVVSNTAWMLGESVIASFLPQLTDRRNMGVVSGFGWGLGYLGGLISMILVSLVIIRANPETEFALYVRQNQWAMVAVALYFAVFAVPTFLWVRHRPQAAEPEVQKQSWYDSLNLGRMAREHPALMKFFFAFLFYMAGVQAVIKFIGIYTSGELGMTAGDLINVFLATQLSAMAGAIGFGFLERAAGARTTLLLTIALWLVAILGMYSLRPLAAILGLDPISLFVVIALLAGTGIGSIQASSRSLVGQLSPDGFSGSAFGLWGFFMRSAAILATFFGVVADLFSRSHALLLVMGFFALGGLLLWRAEIPRKTTVKGAESR